jgi:hypothetical protein
MASTLETVFCWVPVPLLAMALVRSTTFKKNSPYLCMNHLLTYYLLVLLLALPSIIEKKPFIFEHDRSLCAIINLLPIAAPLYEDGKNEKKENTVMVYCAKVATQIK